MKTDNHTFGQAIEAAKQGKLISRGASPGTVIFMQVPSQVPADIIPRMTSLPTSVKELARLRGVPLQYADQFAAIDEQNCIKGWHSMGYANVPNDGLWYPINLPAQKIL